MSYRETPRIAAEDGRLDGVVDDAAARPRLRRFDFVRAERQLDFPCPGCVGSIRDQRGPLGYLGTEALRPCALASSATSISDQIPRYPSSGRATRVVSGRNPSFPASGPGYQPRKRSPPRDGTRTKRLIPDFRLFPWVDDVTRVEYPPHGITVHLVYQQPVAKIPSPPVNP